MAQISEIELNRYDMDTLRNIYVGDVDEKEKEKKIMMINNLKKQELINLIMFMEMRSIELKKEKKEELTKEEKKEELKKFLNPEKSPDLIPSFDEDMYNDNERIDVSSNEFDNNAGSYWFKENNEKVLNMIKDYL
jgi:hypothetical protein